MKMQVFWDFIFCHLMSVSLRFEDCLTIEYEGNMILWNIREPLVHQHNATLQKTWIPSNTTVRT